MSVVTTESRPSGTRASAGSIAPQLAEFIVASRASELPPRVLEIAKDRVLDCIATAFAARQPPVPATVRAL